MTAAITDLAEYRRMREAEREAAREAASTIAGGNVAVLRTRNAPTITGDFSHASH